jgi:hypothetical protein
LSPTKIVRLLWPIQIIFGHRVVLLITLATTTSQKKLVTFSSNRWWLQIGQAIITNKKGKIQ